MKLISWPHTDPIPLPGDERLIENRSQIAVVGQDAVPVYLDLSTIRVLARAEVLDACRMRKHAKRLAEEGKSEAIVELSGVEKPSDAEGASRREKNRMTLFMRQALIGYFDEQVEVPKGEVLGVALLTQAA